MGAPFTLFVDSQFLSPYAMSAYVALTEKKLAFEVRPIDLSAGEQRMVPFQSRSLTSRVPALTHGDFHLTESTAIAEYLEQLYPAPDHLALYPEAPQARARARQLQAWLRSDLGALRQERPTETVFWDQPGQPLSDDGHAAAAKLIHVSSALIGAGQATLFDAWSIADADLATALRRLWLDDLLPDTLRAYAEAQWQRPSLRKWLDHNAAARR
ncbi:glutathione transferase [Achromobacter sp. AONIH1]|uniref:glutathione transferase n=1 Tax=unclassified Achromobacter TaxID=2626865 RepID=UPI000CD14194|nr:glutathione transferase [Achromobacter sp. AONIH1]AUT49549.1 glutathione S-transferase [Achromobacter sp. AONIH1]